MLISLSTQNNMAARSFRNTSTVMFCRDLTVFSGILLQDRPSNVHASMGKRKQQLRSLKRLVSSQKMPDTTTEKLVLCVSTTTGTEHAQDSQVDWSFNSKATTTSAIEKYFTALWRSPYFGGAEYHMQEFLSDSGVDQNSENGCYRKWCR